LLIDTDPGIDDAAAILMALASPEIELVGLTTVAGNVSLPKTTKNALRICELAGADIPVAAGARDPLVQSIVRRDEESVHGADGLGDGTLFEPARQPVAEHAIDFIARLAQQEPLTIAAIGPLTNIAMLLARYPDVVDRIERLVIMGGARLEGNATPAAEFNIWLDPEAAARVFSSGIPIALFPLDITHQAVMTRQEVEQLSETGEIGRRLAELIRFYHAGEYESKFGDFLSPLHDVLTTLYLTRPEAMTYVDASVAVDCGDSISRGATLVNTSDRNPDVKNASVGVDLDRELFARTLIESVRELDARKRAAAAG
jgi:inosine-uridine nucleoside N-ribohydrolase